MSLKTRFSLVIAGFTVAALTFFGAAYYFSERAAEKSAQAEQQRKALSDAVAECAAMDLAANPIAALNFVRSALRDQAVVSAACIDARGIVRAHSDPDRIGRPLAGLDAARAQAIERTARQEDGRRLLEWLGEVRVGRDRLGWAQLVYDGAIIDRRVRERLSSTLRRLAIIGSAASGLSIMIGLLLAGGLIKPIASVVRGARAIGSGRLDHRVDAGRADELGELAREMNVMAERLAELDQLKDDFIHSVSHDLRSPMAAIKMYAEFMLNEDVERERLLPRHREWLATIVENAVRLNVFVSNILDAAKMKAGRMAFDLEAVALQPMISNILSLFTIVARKQEISLIVETGPDLPKIRVDPVRFDQVLINLVSNALKFTPPGGRVTIAAFPSAGGVEIAVSDTGPGISPEELNGLFQRFSMGAAGKTIRHTQGTGLGLSISKEAVEAMGGRITVASEVGRGTTFTVIMPAAGEGA